jgi:hypothetical protein
MRWLRVIRGWRTSLGTKSGTTKLLQKSMGRIWAIRAMRRLINHRKGRLQNIHNSIISILSFLSKFLYFYF